MSSVKTKTRVYQRKHARSKRHEKKGVASVAYQNLDRISRLPITTRPTVSHSKKSYRRTERLDVSASSSPTTSPLLETSKSTVASCTSCYQCTPVYDTML